MEDIGDALGLTTDATYYRFRNSRDGGSQRIGRGRPKKTPTEP